MLKNCYALKSQARQLLVPGPHAAARGRKFSTCRSQLTICMSVSLFYHVQRQNIGAARTSLRLCRRCSVTVTPRHHQAVPTAGHLAMKTVGFSIWASDLEPASRTQATRIEFLEQPCFPDEHNSETRPFPSIVTPLPQTLKGPLLNADSNDWLLL